MRVRCRGGGGLLFGQQAVPHREQRRSGPAGSADLDVDVLHVIARRLRRAVQALAVLHRDLAQ